MNMPQVLFNAVAATVALIPAVLTWVWGRALVGMADDAALPERMMAHRRRVLQAVSITGAVLAVTLPATLPWSLPLLIVARAVAAFRTRQALLRETWTLWQYLATGTRVYVALMGFWVLLAAAPLLVARRPAWAAAVAAVILLAWSSWFPLVTLTLLRARRLASPALAARFGDVLLRSPVRPPGTWRAGPRDNGLANALALHSRRGSQVLFSEMLLDRLTEDETAAVFAHEVAHLEILDRMPVWRAPVATLLLVAAGTAAVPALHGVAGQLAWALNLVWALFVFSYLAFRLRRGQEHELASDRRAAELCGDAEALIRALIKLHEIGRVPRRWEMRVEEAASHPSLARRIQALRAQAPTGQPRFEGSELFRGVDPGTYVVIDNQSVRCFGSVPAGTDENPESLQAGAGTITAIRFSSIAELRVAARGVAPPELVIVECNGKRHIARMRSEDLVRLQRTLDQVDVMVSPAPKSTGYHFRLLSVLLACLASTVAITTVQAFSVAIVALFAALRPTAAIVTAAGTASALGAILTVMGERHCSARELLFLVAVLPLACIALWAGVRRRRRSGQAEETPHWVLWTAAVAAVASWVAPILGSEGHLFRLSEIFRSMQGAALFPLALGILVSQSAMPRRRALALPMIAVAFAAPFIGSDWFRDKVIRDPLLRSTPAFQPATVTPAPRLALFKVGPWPSGLRIAPGGHLVALRHENPDGDEERLPPYVVYGPEDSRRTLECIDLHFLDDRSVLLLRTLGAILELAALPLDGSPPQWQVALEGLAGGRLALSPDGARWRVVSQSRDGRLFRIEGNVRSGGIVRTEWRGPVPDEPWAVQGFAGGGPSALWVRQTWNVPRLGRAASLLAGITGGYATESTVYGGNASSVVPLGRSESRVTCLDPGWDEHRFVCMASHGTLVNVFSVDASAGAVLPVGSIQGYFMATGTSVGDILPGSLDGMPCLLRLQERVIVRLGEEPGDVVIDGGLLGIVPSAPGDSEVSLYRLPPQ